MPTRTEHDCRASRPRYQAKPVQTGQRSRARGGLFRAAPQQPVLGCVAFGFGSGWFRPPGRVLSAPRAADRHTQGGAGGGAAKRRARGTTAATGSRCPWPGAASVERPGHDAPHDKAPRREGPCIGFGCRCAFPARQTAGVMGGGSAAVWPSPSEVAARPAHRTVERGFSESNAQRGG